MHDILPGQAAAWRRIENKVADCFAAYGFGELRTPMLERADLICRPVGNDTDIVQKELYKFTDRDGDDICLRPEATVSAMRALLSSGMIHNKSAKIWYWGPMFRRERPQKGRFRQFHQFGAESVGSDSPQCDAEIILLTARIWRELGIAAKVVLEINNMGNLAERKSYRSKLSAYLAKRKDKLDEVARGRIDTNPLRILDSKDPATNEVIAEAPILGDDLGEASRKHCERVAELVAAGGVDFRLNHRLVRGLDYYNLTVFEWQPAGGEHFLRQDTLAGGGRYDGLGEMLGGRRQPSCGFAAGVERVAELAAGPALAAGVDVYFAAEDGALPLEVSIEICERLRDAGLTVESESRGGKIAALHKKAVFSDARSVVLVGKAEVVEGCATVSFPRSDITRRKLSLQSLPVDLPALLSEMNS